MGVMFYLMEGFALFLQRAVFLQTFPYDAGYISPFAESDRNTDTSLIPTFPH